MPDDITKSDREAFHGGQTYSQTAETQVRGTSNDTALSIAKVFLYMFGGLLITTLVAFGLGAVVSYNLLAASTEEGTINITTPYLIALIASAVLLFIDMLVINFVTLKGKHSILVPAIIYATLVGVLFSFLTIVVDWRVLGMAFGITTFVFLLMSIIAFLSKGNMSPLLILGLGLLIGGGLLALFNWIFIIATGTSNNVLYWVITFVIFAAIMLITIFDIWRIKKIADAGAMNNNIALYCAFTMYVDFINIFIRILYFLLIILGKAKR